MSLVIDNTMAITMYKGDTGNILFEGLPTDREYTGWFAVNDDDTGRVLFEKQSTYNKSEGTAIASITEDDDIPVGEWSYTFKLCYALDGIENTVLPYLDVVDGVTVQQTPPMFIVLDKRAEGI